MPVEIPVLRLKEYCNPFVCNPWTDRRLTRAAIATSIRNGRLNEKPLPEPSVMKKPEPHSDHVGRIAYFAVNGWADAIQIDVGIPSLGCHIDWMITDGNHRFAAAMYRGDHTILAQVSGCLEYALHLFGIDCQEDFEQAA